MSNYRTSADLITAALFNAGEPTDGTSDYNTVAQEYLNRTYQSVWMGGSELDPEINEEWHWLLSSTPGVITLQPAISTGTVQVTQNSVGITFSPAPTPSIQGRFFRVNNDSDIFRIASHTAGAASANLDSVYTGANAATASYKVFALDYNLPSDCIRPVAPMRVYREERTEIQGVAASEMEVSWPLARVEGGLPYQFAMVGDQKVRFSHYGSDTGDYIRIDFDYLQIPADLTNTAASIPVLPFQYRKLLADFVSFKILLDKSDEKAEAFGAIGKAGLRAMAGENRHKMAVAGRERGHIYPRPNDTAPFARPLRTQSGLIIG